MTTMYRFNLHMEKSALNPNFQNLAQQINIDEMNNSTVQVNQWFIMDEKHQI